jgi:hypothetical protein
VIRRAAEISKSRRLQGEVRKPDHRTAIQILRLQIELEPPAFEQGHAQRATIEVARERNPRRTRPNDADVRINRRPGRATPRIVDHDLPRDIGQIDPHGRALVSGRDAAAPSIVKPSPNRIARDGDEQRCHPGDRRDTRGESEKSGRERRQNPEGCAEGNPTSKRARKTERLPV